MHIDILLERIFIDILRSYNNLKYQANFTTKNKKLQKKKIKAKKKKEQELEKLREEQEKKEQSDKITTNNDRAVELLLMQTISARFDKKGESGYAEGMASLTEKEKQESEAS
jgi:fructose-1,6-bisphosphatase/inositol monophosphatase family enzyme